MNRKQRRAAKNVVHGPLIAGARELLNRLDFHCPDCDSDLTRSTDEVGIEHLTIHHDETCPQWLAMRPATEGDHHD